MYRKQKWNRMAALALAAALTVGGSFQTALADGMDETSAAMAQTIATESETSAAMAKTVAAGSETSEETLDSITLDSEISVDLTSEKAKDFSFTPPKKRNYKVTMRREELHIDYDYPEIGFYVTNERGSNCLLFATHLSDWKPVETTLSLSNESNYTFHFFTDDEEMGATFTFKVEEAPTFEFVSWKIPEGPWNQFEVENQMEKVEVECKLMDAKDDESFWIKGWMGDMGGYSYSGGRLEGNPDDVNSSYPIYIDFVPVQETDKEHLYDVNGRRIAKNLVERGGGTYWIRIYYRLADWVECNTFFLGQITIVEDEETEESEQTGQTDQEGQMDQERQMDLEGQTDQEGQIGSSARTSGLKLTADKITLQKGQTTNKLRVVEMAAGDFLASVTSGNPKILKVSNVKPDGSFKLKALKVSKKPVKLMVTLASGLSRTVKATVQANRVTTKKITGIRKKLTMKAGQKEKLEPVLTPITTQDKLTFTTSDKKVVTVSKKGVLAAKKAGKAKITVQSGKKKVICTVTVKK